MCDMTRWDKTQNDNIRENIEITPIIKKIVENKQRWYLHVDRKFVNFVVKRVNYNEGNQTDRGRGKFRKNIREYYKRY